MAVAGDRSAASVRGDPPQRAEIGVCSFHDVEIAGVVRGQQARSVRIRKDLYPSRWSDPADLTAILFGEEYVSGSIYCQVDDDTHGALQRRALQIHPGLQGYAVSSDGGDDAPRVHSPNAVVIE